MKLTEVWLFSEKIENWKKLQLTFVWTKFHFSLASGPNYLHLDFTSLFQVFYPLKNLTIWFDCSFCKLSYDSHNSTWFVFMGSVSLCNQHLEAGLLKLVCLQANSNIMEYTLPPWSWNLKIWSCFSDVGTYHCVICSSNLDWTQNKND